MSREEADLCEVSTSRVEYVTRDGKLLALVSREGGRLAREVTVSEGSWGDKQRGVAAQVLRYGVIGSVCGVLGSGVRGDRGEG